MSIRAFIITLENAVERRSQVERIRLLCPLESQILDAVDGRAMERDQLLAYVGRRLFYPHYPFSLRPGEIGHFLSQRKAWKAIVDQRLDAGLLLEDDIEFSMPAFSNGLDLAISALRPYDIIKFRPSHLGATEKKLTAFHTTTFQSPQLIEPTLAPLGTTSLLVTRSAAERLLELTERFDRPADAFLQLTWVTGIRPRLIIPAGVQEISHRLGGSTIQVKQRPALETIYRNVARPMYRTQLKGMAYWDRFYRAKQNRVAA